MFDEKTLNEITQGNQNQINDLLNTFYRELEKKIPLLTKYVKESKTLSLLKEEMHQLKSNLILIDEELGQRFVALERELKEKDTLDESFVLKLNSIIKDLSQLNNQVETYLSKHQ